MMALHTLCKGGIKVTEINTNALSFPLTFRKNNTVRLFALALKIISLTGLSQPVVLPCHELSVDVSGFYIFYIFYFFGYLAFFKLFILQFYPFPICVLAAR